MTVLSKKFVDEDCYSAALGRFEEMYDRFDQVAISFSGGKDSTSCLNLAIQVATAKKRLPVKAYFFDEEALHPETIDYVTRVHQRDDVVLTWFCTPLKHRNACSRKSPWWYPWAPEDKHLWVRDYPSLGVHAPKGWVKGMNGAETALHILGPEAGTVALVRGLRADESLNRYRSVANARHDNWYSSQSGKFSHITLTSPIYDWTTSDVWLAAKNNEWDYNSAYDVFFAAGVAPDKQRVCPPYGEEPLGGLYQYAECWPELWHKMLARVPGVATAARYARTELYGYGRIPLPPGKTWQSWFYDILKSYGAAERSFISEAATDIMRKHARLTADNIPEDAQHPVTGLSWRTLCVIALRGDLKGRRVSAIGGKTRERERK